MEILKQMSEIIFALSEKDKHNYSDFAFFMNRKTFIEFSNELKADSELKKVEIVNKSSSFRGFEIKNSNYLSDGTIVFFNVKESINNFLKYREAIDEYFYKKKQMDNTIALLKNEETKCQDKLKEMSKVIDDMKILGSIIVENKVFVFGNYLENGFNEFSVNYIQNDNNKNTKQQIQTL